MVACASCKDLPASCSRCSRSMPTLIVSPSPTIDRHLAFADDRLLVLGDLIALRQVRVEVVLAVEAALQVDLGGDTEAGAHGLRDALAVDHRQHPRHRRVDQADVRVGRRAERGRRAGEQLRPGNHLGMNLHADDDFPVAGGALDQLSGVGCATHTPPSGSSVVDDRLPFVVERTAGLWFAGTAIPVAGIGLVALDAVEVGMDPRRRLALVVLHDPVRLVPLAFGGVPHRSHRAGEPGRRLGLCRGGAKSTSVHLNHRASFFTSRR